MLARHGDTGRPVIRRGIAWAATTALVGAASMAAIVGSLGAGGAAGSAGPGRGAPHGTRLAATTCTGPTGTLFVAEAGYDALGVIDTATCAYTATDNVGDPPASNQTTDINYSSTDEAVAVDGSDLYIADAGASTVAVIDIATLATLPATDYTPPEMLINVGFFPEDLAVTPNGSQVWVADTGPQTGATSNGEPSYGQGGAQPQKGGTPFTAVSVITASTKTVVGTIPLTAAPQEIAFSPNGQLAYVTTPSDLVVIDVASRRVVGQVSGLQNPHGIAVSPDGSELYVTDATSASVSVIDAHSLRVTRTISVGQMPWAVTLSSTGTTAYVANPDSDTVSVVDTTTASVVGTISLAADPEALALSPDGTTLWVGEGAGGAVAVIDTADGTQVGKVELGFGGPQSGDGDEPTGLAFVG